METSHEQKSVLALVRGCDRHMGLHWSAMKMLLISQCWQSPFEMSLFHKL